MKALVLNEHGDLLYWVEAPEGVSRIEVAGAVAADGAPVNVRRFRVSQSKKNLARAARVELSPLRKMEYRGSVVFIE